MRTVLSAGVVAIVLALACVMFGSLQAVADTVDEQAREIAKQLQCPVCNGSTVADSPSDLAAQMRAVIRQKVEAGESRDLIIQYFVDRYGDSILMEPPRRGFGLWVWLAPVVMLMVGVIILATVLRGWIRRGRPLAGVGTALVPVEPIHRNGTAHASADGPVSALDRVQSELDQYRRDA